MKYRVYGYKKENYELAILGLEHFNREAFYVEARDENDAVSAFHFEHPGSETQSSLIFFCAN